MQVKCQTTYTYLYLFSTHTYILHVFFFFTLIATWYLNYRWGKISISYKLIRLSEISPPQSLS